MLELGLKILISYLAGSLNGALIVGRIAGGVDIRKLGSRNAGGTNALRTQGKLFAFWVMVIDIGKGYLPAFLLPALALPGVPLDPEISRTWLMLACAGAAVVGHCYPVWFGFEGGKGFATAMGALLAIDPAVFGVGVGVWIVVVVLTGYVGLSTICAAIAFPVFLALSSWPERQDAMIFLVFLAGFIVFTHRANIRRMLKGEEHRWEKIMILRRSS